MRLIYLLTSRCKLPPLIVTFFIILEKTYITIDDTKSCQLHSQSMDDDDMTSFDDQTAKKVGE